MVQRGRLIGDKLKLHYMHSKDALTITYTNIAVNTG